MNLARDERGNMLITAVLLVFATSMIGALVATMSATDLKISGNQELGTEAFFAAEAGLSEAIHRLALPDSTKLVVGGRTVNASIADMPPYDPNYKVYILLTPAGAEPTVAGSTITAGTLQDLSGDPLAYSRDSGTDEVITVEHEWEDRNGDGVRDANEIVLYDASRMPSKNFARGNPVEVITVTGRSGAAKRVLQAEVTRRKLMMQTLGALYTDKAVEISGSSAFCGWNHDVSIPPGTLPNVCFKYHLSDGHLAGVTTTDDKVQEKGKAHDIEGSPTPTDTDPANPWYTLAEALGITQNDLNQVLANADNTSIVNPLDGITYIQGDATINAGVVGRGLLYVTEDVTINGDFEYQGFIYVEGDCKITGAPWILGSLAVQGTSDFTFAAGNAGVLFSEDAIQLDVGGILPVVTLAWRDL